MTIEVPLSKEAAQELVTRVVTMVLHELHAANDKFGPFASAHEGYAVIKEELDEAWDAIKANNVAGARLEMVQVAAMAIRFLLDVPVPEQQLDPEKPLSKELGKDARDGG